jgi:CheY-like chemotaxis protein
MLEQAGYKMHYAMLWPEWVQQVSHIPPSFVILDIQLPGMNGLEVPKCIHAGSIGKDISIIAMTSFGMSGDNIK